MIRAESYDPKFKIYEARFNRWRPGTHVSVYEWLPPSWRVEYYLKKTLRKAGFNASVPIPGTIAWGNVSGQTPFDTILLRGEAPMGPGRHLGLMNSAGEKCYCGRAYGSQPGRVGGIPLTNIFILTWDVPTNLPSGTYYLTELSGTSVVARVTLNR